MSDRTTLLLENAIVGSKGSKGSSTSEGAHEDPNSLRSNIKARVIDLIGEGEIEGIVGGLKGVYFDRTPVMNEDGTLNFKGVEFEFRNGLPDQEELKGFPMTETPFQVSTRVYKAQGPVVRTIQDPNATAVRVVVQLPSLTFTVSEGKSAGVYKNNTHYAFDVRANNGAWVEAISVAIEDKCTSPYQRAHRLDLPAGGYPWQIRMRRVKVDATDDKSQDQTYFDSYVEVVEARLTYMHSAVAGLQVDARQFGSSIPARSYRVRGLKFQVPSNYDPVARTYSGIWDGTFKTAWTNNPAWVFYGLITNDRFGLGEFVNTANVDVASLYQIGQYCDQIIEDGFGGHEPRFVYNGVINTFSEAHKCLQSIAASFRGMSFWSLGQVFAVADMPKDPIVNVTKANTIGGFEYSGTAMKSRHTVASVSWNDPADFYRPAIELVRDNDAIRRYGWRQVDVVAEGCTSRGQAHRYGSWIIDSEQNETESVVYRASYDHLGQNRDDIMTGVLPGDVVAIADPRKMNIRAGGRIASVLTGNQVQLDAPFAMVAGESYSLKITQPDATVEVIPIVGINATNVALLARNMTQTPIVGAVYLVSGTDAAPRQFRVLDIAEDAKNVFKVTGLFFDPNKFLRVERGIKLPPIAYTRPKRSIKPPTNLQVTESNFFVDGIQRSRLTLSWTPGSDFLSRDYMISAETPAGFRDYGSVGNTVYDIENSEAGRWVFTITARSNTSGVFSEPVSITFDALGWAGVAGPTIVDLAVAGGGLVFNGRAASFAWNVAWPAGATTYDLDFLIRIFDVGSGALVRTAISATNAWTYTYEDNQNDARAQGLSGARRQFRVSVAARDILGRVGAPSAIVATNPPPAMVLPSLDSVNSTLFVSAKSSPDPDWAGGLTWVSTTQGFNPLTTPPTYDDTSNLLIVPAANGTTYYVRYAPYDAFGKNPAELNISPEQSKRVSDTLFNPNGPAQPTGLALTTASETLADGTVMAAITAIWSAPAASDDAYGNPEIEIAEGAGPNVSWIASQVPAAQRTWTQHGLRPGVTYSVRMRFRRNATALLDGAYTPTQTIVAARNLTPPANPTNLTVNATNETVFLSFTPSVSLDVKWVEVWAFAGTSTDAAPPTGATMVGRAPGGATQFIDRVAAGSGRTYWLRAINTSDVAAIAYLRSSTIVAPGIVAAQLAAGIIDATKIANNLRLVETNLSALPTTGNTDGRSVVVNGVLYTYSAATGKFTAPGETAKAENIAGKITGEQIDGLLGAQVAGALSASTIAALNTNQSIRGIVAAQIASVSPDAFTRQISDADILSLQGTKVAGALSTTTIAALNANKSITGIVASQIASVNPDAFTRQISDADILSLQGTKIAGTLSPTTIAALNTNKSITGIVASQIASVNPSALTAKLTADQIAGITAAQLTTQITKTNIADGAIDTPQLNAGAVVAAKIAAGAITTSKLAVGGANNAFNSDFNQGLLGWSVATIVSTANGVGPVIDGIDSTYCPSGFKSIRTRLSGAPSSNAGAYDVIANAVAANGVSANYPAVAGAIYEISAYLSPHRCSGYVVVAFYNAAGNSLSTVTGNRITNQQPGITTPLALWDSNYRTFVVCTAPAGAVSCTIRFRADSFQASADQSSASYLFVSGLMFAPAYNMAQTEPTPYAPGGITTIQGGNLLTGSVGADRIVAGSVTTLQLNASEIFADTGVINTITAKTITTANLTAKLVDAEFVSAKNIAAGSILTSKLAVSSANQAFNTDGSQGTRGFNGFIDMSGFSGTVGLSPETNYAPTGFTRIQIGFTGNIPANTSVILDTASMTATGTRIPYPVTPGVTYEFSAAVAHSFGAAYAGITWIKADGTYVSESGGAATGSGGIGGALRTYPRAWVIATAPAGAVRCYPKISFRSATAMTDGNGGMTALMFASCLAGQTEPSPYVAPGVTVLDGSSIYTGTLGADRIVSNSITTLQLNATQIFADDAVINTITAKTITTVNLTAKLVDAEFVNAKNVVAGAITTSKLAIGGANIAFNADFGMGTLGWQFVTIGGTANGLAPVIEGIDTQFCPSGLKAIRCRLNGVPTTNAGVYDVIANTVSVGGATNNYGVSGGAIYEFSAYLSAHGCSGFILAAFYDAAGNALGTFSGNRVTNIAPSITSPLSAWNASYRSFFVCTAPAGAVSCSVRVRMDTLQPAANANTTPFIFVSGLMFAPAYKTTQTEPTPYEPGGVTTIQGGNLLSNSVAATSIVAGSVTTLQLNATQIFADEAVINTITAKTITTANLTAKLVNAEFVSAKNILAGAITASKLTLSDPSNMLLNGDFLSGSTDGWIMVGNASISTAGPTDIGGQWRAVGSSYIGAYTSVFAQVTPGDVLYVSCMINNQRPNGSAGVYVEFTAQDGSNLFTAWPSARSEKNQWVRVEGRVTAPVGTQRVRFHLFADYAESGPCYWGKCQMRRAAAAEMIVDGSITAAKVNVGELFANEAVISKITAGVLTVGAVKADQIAAGAVSADKLGVGLVTGNLFWNSDFSQQGFYQFGMGVAGSTVTYRTDWAVSGLTSLCMNNPGNPAAGTANYVDISFPNADGSRTILIPVQAGKLYEFSAYISAHRCRGYIQAFNWNGANYNGGSVAGNVVSGVFNRQPTDEWRSRLRIRAAPDTTHIQLRMIQEFTLAGNDCYAFFSAPYFGLIPDTTTLATPYAPYAPQSRTVIDGGQVATNSLHADKITAGTISTGKLEAGRINASVLDVSTLTATIINSGVITADNLKIGNGTLSSVLAGTNSTTIDGGAISANTIAANKLRIGNRGLNIVGLNLRFDTASRQIQWDGGAIFWVNDQGVSQGVTIVAGAVQVSGSNYYAIVWPVGADHLDASLDINFANNSVSHVCMATYGNTQSGLAVNYGSTVIDGDQIITGSVKAAKIAADQIQTYHMQANTISGDRIAAGTLVAEKISSGTITAGTLYLKNDRFWLDGGSQLIRIRNLYNSAEQVSIGCVGLFYGNPNDYGMILRNSDGVEVMRVAGGYARMTGAIIDDASILSAKIGNGQITSAKIGDAQITSAKIGDLQVNTAKIADLTVGNTKITDLAATQVVAATPASVDTGNISIFIRGSGKVVVTGFFTGDSTKGFTGGVGALILQRDGTNIAVVNSSYWYDARQAGTFYLNAFSIVAIDTPGAGTHSYRCVSTNTSAIGNVSLLVQELAK